MSVAVLIPWRPSSPDRQRALDHVLAKYAQAGFDVAIGRGDEDGPWIKAEAVADALTQTQAEVVAVCDADVWTDGLPEAVRTVQDGAGWAIPHRVLSRLSKQATDAYIAGEPWEGLPLDQRPYLGVEGGGIVVLRRDTYERVPIDARFVGYGQEDDSWALALRTMVGPAWRGTADLIHCWHEPQPRMTRRRGNAEGWQLYRRYIRASRDPLTMAALIEEGRTCRSQTCSTAP